jgi:23S rRNA (adenine2503-C2)-methyltransferase
MIKIDNYTKAGLIDFCESLNEKSFRGKQLYKWMFSKKIFDFDEMTDLSKPFRKKLKEVAEFTKIEIQTTQSSKKDSSTKFLFKLEDDNFIESVILVDDKRYTACVSSQVGCRMGCTFCNTAKIGLIRNLTTAEIVKQVIKMNEFLQEKYDKKLTNIVFMGMGEPLDNFDNLVNAFKIIQDDEGLNFSHRKVTVSTSGIVPLIIKLTSLEKAPNIAISLNATDDTIRSQIMPINKKYPIKTIIECLKTISLDKRKRVTIEYVLLNGINDSLKNAEKLANMLKNLPIKVNLINYNKTADIELKSPDRAQVLKFQEVLVNANISCFIRKSLGSDIDGACGQLYAKNK